MQHLLRVLEQWTATRVGAIAEPVAGAPGLSGARVWRVVVGDREFALRRWPPQMHADRLAMIHVFQTVLGAYGPPIVPLLQKTIDGATSAVVEGRLWELASWRPGAADFRARPTAARLTAAMRALAAIHETAHQHIVTPWPFRFEARHGRTAATSERRRSATAAQRGERLGRLVSAAGRDELRCALNRASSADEPLVAEVVARIERLAPLVHAKAVHWQEQDLPLQYRLGDIHHDHVLFVDDDVTGIIDFGGVEFGAPAADVARLLGSLVGRDRERWRLALEAYRTVRPWSDQETAAAEFFDSSGVVVAAANWVAWLWPAPGVAGFQGDRAAGIERLRQLLARLRELA
jgi:Ser/Thr protein kinase RdoA (MazF antagonist)